MSSCEASPESKTPVKRVEGSPFTRLLRKKKENQTPKQLASRISELEAALAESQSENAALRSELAQLKEKKQRMKEELTGKRKRVVELEEKMAGLESKLGTMTTKNWREFCGTSGPTFVESPLVATAPAEGDSAPSSQTPERALFRAPAARRARAESLDLSALAAAATAGKYSTLSPFM